MAEGRRESEDDGKESDKNRTYDARLDFFSDKFDPLLALNTPDLKVPDATAKKYDNLALYHGATDQEKRLLKENWSKKQKPSTSTSVTIERRFLPHQMPVKAKSSFKIRNVFTRMETMGGPLALLRKCKDERLKIKVWTRHAKGVRGYCLGYVAAFDKHWNVALEEVTEVWTRPKKRKMPALDSAVEGDKPQRRVRLPKIEVTPHETDKKLENCTRRVEQLLMRGEHIVLIRVMDESAAKT